MNSFNLKIAMKAYSEREAWEFIKTHGHKIHISIRQLANLWNWHRSKVERFLKILRSETLIETKTSQGKTTIITLVNKGVDKLHHSNSQDNFETLSGTYIEGTNIKNQSQDSLETKNKTIKPQENQRFKEIDETELRQFQDSFTSKEEKKKRSKKRKEEIKEKPLLKEGKKEKNFSEENFPSDSDKSAQEVLEEVSTKLPVLKRYPNNVIAEDVMDWAKKNLPQNINIEWELEKFKEYHKPKRNKQMKDAVAFFKGWLKKSIEFNSINNIKTLGGNSHEHFKFSQNRETKTEFERFLAGGYRAVDRIRRSGLDRQAYRQI